MVESFLEFLEIYISEYGYITAFLFAVVENSAFVGLIFPGAIAVVLFGFYAAKGVIDPYNLAACLIVGSIIGNNLGYFLGFRYGRGLVKKVGKIFSFEEEKFKYAENFYKKNGSKTIIWGRLVAMAGTFIPFTAGMSKMNYARFMAFDIFGAFLWVSFLMSLGYFFGAHWEKIVGYVGNLGILLLVVFGIVIYKFIKEQGDESS